MLPAFEIALGCHGQTVTLRASLRAAVTCDAMPGGFPSICDQIARQSLSTVRTVILAAASDRQEAHRFLTATADVPLASFLPEAQAACLAVMAALIQPSDDIADQVQSQDTSGATMTLRAYFQTLYGYATGWLGWTASETWNASPQEIEAAFETHVDRLMKLTPGLSSEDSAAPGTSTPYTPKRLQEIDALGFDPAFDRAALAALKARHE